MKLYEIKPVVDERDVAEIERQIKVAEKGQGWYGGVSGTEYYNRDWKKELSALKKRLKAAKAGKLHEEALETKTAEDLWSENGDAAAYYTYSSQYLVRPIKNTSPQQYEAFSVEGDSRKPFGKFTADKLKATLEPLRANQKPDAEGFTTYVDPNKVQAFKYAGDPVKVMLGKVGARLNNGDYLVRTNDGNDFEYAIEKASEFEATLTKVG